MAKYDKDVVKSYAEGNWVSILSTLSGLAASPKHGPCPKGNLCSGGDGGGTDRFRCFNDFEKTGGVICNKCGKFSDGLATMQWINGISFVEAIDQVGDYLGCEPKQSKKKQKFEREVNWQKNHDRIANSLAVQSAPHFPGINALPIERHCKFGFYKCHKTGKTYPILAIPHFNQRGAVCGYEMAHRLGEKIPRVVRDNEIEYVKTRMTTGSNAGLIIDKDRWAKLDQYSTILKVEGWKDYLAAYDRVPDDWVVINTGGAGNDPARKQWITAMAAGKDVVVCHDADEPGQRGATYVPKSDGGKRDGWCPAFLNAGAKSVRNVQLPFVIEKSEGKDLRDYFVEGNTWDDFMGLVEETECFQVEPEVRVEAPRDRYDPLVIAKANIERYRRQYGGHIRWWKQTWYVYKGSHYDPIGNEEMEARVREGIIEEFERIYWASQQDDNPEETVRAVKDAFVKNVVNEIRHLARIPQSVELNIWYDRESGEKDKRQYLSMRNGLLDTRAYLEGDGRHFHPHSPHWFSTIATDYEYQPDADIPTQWLDVLNFSLEEDRERIGLLQEWFGYCLTPDTRYQRFMMMEGQGGNGKSVILACLRALLGSRNITSLQLENFKEAGLSAIVGKLALVCPDVTYIPPESEGPFKAIVSGDRVNLQRKYKESLEHEPTARIIFSCNRRPRIKDTSDGIWRRLILMPFNIQVPPERRIFGIDNEQFWLGSGEMSGILRWALAGLRRLHDRGDFLIPEICQLAAEEYRSDSTPTREFIKEFLQLRDMDYGTACSDAYDAYKKWADSNGLRSLDSRAFGREISKVYKRDVEFKRKQDGSREWRYYGLALAGSTSF